MRKKVLVVEDDAAHAELILRAFATLKQEYTLTVAGSLADARAQIAESWPDLLLADYRLPDGDGQELVKLAAEAFPLVLMTAFGDEQLAVQAIKAGAADYIVKSPEAFAALPHAVGRALREWELMADRAQAQAALRESEERLRNLINLMPDIVCFKDGQGRWLEANAHDLKLFQLEGVNFRGLKDSELAAFSPFYHDAFMNCETSDEKAWQARGLVRGDEVIPLPDGTARTYDIIKLPLFNPDGSRKGLIVVGRDITDRLDAQKAQRESEDRFRAIFDSTFQFTGLMTPDGLLLEANRAALDFAGATLAAVVRQPFWETPWWRGNPERVRRLKEAVAEAATGKFIRYEVELQGAGTQTALIDFSIKPMLDPDGKVKLLIPEGRDISSLRAAEEEQRKLRDQLVQAQKMESVGRLAGGVAHDFNNMLGVIIGHAELALMQVDKSHPLHQDLEDIQQAAQRSADLTRQLLAFARKQTVMPQVLDLNLTVSGMLKMLGRLIGEDIELEWNPGADLWPVHMDPSQIDQIMVNLVVNSRDAITGPGKVTIATSNVSIGADECADNPEWIAGEYVRILVRDTGCGMDKTTLSHLFEPFFTTKGVGRGTGLGLSTVYGVAKQNNGHITVASIPGRGTEFMVYLPRFIPSPSNEAAKPATSHSLLGTETILLVEDEPAILFMGKAMLERLGYTVFSALTPQDALHRASTFKGKIDLLITDVVMPDMNGQELAERIMAIHPGVKCVFTSGYTADVISHKGMIEKGVCFIQKPFSINTLGKTIREALAPK